VRSEFWSSQFFIFALRICGDTPMLLAAGPLPGQLRELEAWDARTRVGPFLDILRDGPAAIAAADVDPDELTSDWVYFLRALNAHFCSAMYS